MLFRIPILVQQEKGTYVARPLFHVDPERSDATLNRLYAKLTRDLTQRFETLAREQRHDALASMTFAPAVTTHRHDITIELKRRRVKVKLFFVQFQHFGRKVAFSPAVPAVWFEIARGETLAARAEEVLQDYWRTQERDAAQEEDVQPQQAALKGKAWVHTLVFNARTRVPAKSVVDNPFLILGGGEMTDGATELRRVGRCLDWLYPDELDRAVHRDSIVNELARQMTAVELRPVLLVGPRQCGKTAILHECIYRMIANRLPEEKRKPGQVWLVSPQRLISGMSFVGQWEARLLAILKHARKKKHTLYFDDLVGLFLAGMSSNSTLSAAMVLKPYLEDRTIRVVSEITPEQLQVLRERDRGFADLFQILPVTEPTPAETARILTAVERRLEGRHAFNFALEVQPTVVDLQRRFERNAAFPGKAVAVMTRLAVRAAKLQEKDDAEKASHPMMDRPQIQREDVLNDAAARSGLSLPFLDPNQRLDRDDIRKQLATLVIGQGEAVDAVADVISVAKARLNDPNRPLASFLFLGPTGVGKTEMAKSAARVLLGDADRLVRFDLNEYNTPGAAARLVGTFDQPEGLLTAAVRRQPFCVLLLDEIEKAEREVHDVLLQVLGEGRLTDALGRTADFTNAIILLTSNLGVREAESRLGLRPATDTGGAYVRAAERFFRPEFFNRLDRVIPFHKLSRDEMSRIAERLVSEVLAREGFQQRQCVMTVLPEALERVIDAGYDPVLGARAMKRAVERELTRPAAARLAALTPGDLTVVTVKAEGANISVDVMAPGWAPRVNIVNDASIEERVGHCREALDRLEELILAARPSQNLIAGRITTEQERYYELKERASTIATRLEALEEKLESKRTIRFENVQPGAMGKKSRYRVMKHWSSERSGGVWDQPVRSLFAAISMEEALDELYASAEALPGDGDMQDLENELGLLNLMATNPHDDKPVYLWLKAMPNAANLVPNLIRNYLLYALRQDLGIELDWQPSMELGDPPYPFFEVKGFHARALVQTEVGTHLVLPKAGGPQPVRVAVTDSLAPPAFDTFGPILRIYPDHKPLLDIRTGLVSAWPVQPATLRSFILTALPRA
jgi:ATP-dependent Clp protease ATP-binding subunit ClpC